MNSPLFMGLHYLTLFTFKKEKDIAFLYPGKSERNCALLKKETMTLYTCFGTPKASENRWLLLFIIIWLSARERRFTQSSALLRSARKTGRRAAAHCMRHTLPSTRRRTTHSSYFTLHFPENFLRRCRSLWKLQARREKGFKELWRCARLPYTSFLAKRKTNQDCLPFAARGTLQTELHAAGLLEFC